MKNNVSLFKQLISGLTSKLLFRLLFAFNKKKKIKRSTRVSASYDSHSTKLVKRNKKMYLDSSC